MIPGYRGGDRARNFRKRHYVGELLSGRLVRWLGSGLGVVDIRGQELTALIRSRPSPGDVLHFYVERLYPDIVLHEIRSGEQGPGPMKMAAAFREARDEAWRTVSPLIDDIGAAAPMERRRLLHERVTAGSGTLFAHLRLLATTQVLNGLLRNTCGAVMSAPFWLFPAQGLEMLVFPRRREAIGECLAHFILPEAGRVEINVFGLEKGIGWRLYCENPSFPSAEQLFPAEWTCLGLHEMPEFMASGLLPRFLPSAGSSMGFERRV